MSKQEIHPDFKDLEIEKAKTYLSNAALVNIVDENEQEIMMILYGNVVGDDTGQFQNGDVVVTSAIATATHQLTRFKTKTQLYYVTNEPVDFVSLTVAEWLLMLSTKDSPMNILLNRYFRDSNL